MSASATLFDANLWVALAFDSHPLHSEARQEFEAADSARPAVFCRVTQLSFIRLLTTPLLQKVYRSGPITNDRAWQKWEMLMNLPQVAWFQEPAGLEQFWQEYARKPSVSPKLWMDAYLAAFARGHRIPIATLDKDLTRFENLSCRYLPGLQGPS